ncbi:MAG: histidine--tRNA ligase [Candidatus Moraniibacteriota bacterium]|jgi:histidyl-tRNA synthetase
MSKKNGVTTRALSGFMELLPEEQIVFNDMLDVIRQSYETFGFSPINTPILERAEALLAKAGGETEKQIYRFTKGSSELAMRFDLTVPLSRYVVEHYGEIAFPFRRYAIGKVFRGERSQAGRFREFYQCDIDVIGDEVLDLRFDAEIPSVIYMIFKKLGFDAFTIRVNNRKVFNGLFEGLEITNLSADIMRSIDKLEKIGRDAVVDELIELGVTKATVDRIFEFLSLKGDAACVLEGLSNLNIESAQFDEGVEELQKVTEMMKQFGVPESNFVIDLTIARGLDYYTGTVYETQLDEYPEFGSVCSGGRYDDLASAYTDRKLPGVGISIGLTRLFDQLRKKGLLEIKSSTKTRVLIIPMTDDIDSSIAIATALRNDNIATEISFSNGKLKQKLKYANRKGIPFVIFIGEDEIEKGVYTLKDFVNGTQESLVESELLQKLKNP